jgi:glycosyltransferase involved in cell wall biosynthesis
MKKVLFFIHNGWVFGKIHNELIKALHPDVYCDILCWTGNYSKHEFEYIKKKYDYFVSTPEGCFALFDRFQVPLEKSIGVLHQDWDVFNPLKNGAPKEYFDRLAGYGVIAPILTNISFTHGIGRVPELLRIGTFQNNYPNNKSDALRNIGYFAKHSRLDQGFDVKRGNLVEAIASKTGLGLVKNEGVNFLGAENLYQGIDLVICPSLVEGNPYPMLEAFSCGIPVLITQCGIAPEYVKHGGGKLLPFNADEFVYSASYEIEKMKADPSYYRKLCDESYEIGKSIDWSIIRSEWVEFFNSLK